MDEATRKKVWRVELELLDQFRQCCEQYGLRWFAGYGTLLGAVRHKGFIPWDDDLDVVMFRDDYMKLKEVASAFFRSPYFFQDSYTDPEMIWGFSKIRDDRTSAIEFPWRTKAFHQGIFIDIFPLDDAPDDLAFRKEYLQVEKEVWISIVDPEQMISYLENGGQTIVGTRKLCEIMKLPPTKRFAFFEETVCQMQGRSIKCAFISDQIAEKRAYYEKEWFDRTEYLPFEGGTIPAPYKYDEVLKTLYGDYMTPVYGGSDHEGIFLDPDHPYTDYIE